MSILLEALKKSEEQRQLGTTPTLQTPGAAVAGPRSPTNRWVVGAMAIVAVGIMTWAGWSQFRPPVSLATADAPAAVADDTAAPVVAEASRRVGREATRGATPAVGPTPDDRADSVPRPPAAEVEPELRPLESMGVPRERTAGNKADQRRQLARNFRSFAAQEQQSEPAAAPGAETGGADPVRPAEPRTAPVDPAAALAEESAAAVVRARPADPAVDDDTISYWQIPASTRESMPELRIRVLVFADRAEDRFLLVNDQRLREGEELEPGLRLEEIRRDRAVFTYRNYRFHLKG